MKTYIVLDLEWNQAPEGKSGTIPEIPFEIIEIGACKLNEDLQIIDSFHKLIKPKVYKKMHFKVHEVIQTGIEDLRKQGEPFRSAAEAFLAWCFSSDETPIFCSWGNMDLTELQRNMQYYNVPNPFPSPLLYYDIQKLYNIIHKSGGSGVNKLPLDKVCKDLGIQSSRPFHHAPDDAHYTALVMQSIDFKSVSAYLSLDYFDPPRSKEEEIYLVFPDYSKYVSSTFSQKEDILKNKTVSDVICYRCKRMLRKKISWFSSNQKTYYALSLCPEHGFLQAKIRIKSTCDKQYFAIKTIKLVDAEAAKSLGSKRDEARKKRREKNKAKKSR